MTRVFLIRHGQAGQLTDYDLLSALGWEQARRCGEGWRHLGALPRLYRGAMRRHRETLEAFQASYGSTADVVELPGFDEFDHEDVLAVEYPDLQDKETRVAWLASHDRPGRAIADAFKTSMERWTRAGDASAYRESFPVFQARAMAALDEVIERTEPEGTAVVITSGGTIATIASALLGVPAARALDLCWSIVNTGVTQVRASGEARARRSVEFFNNYQHLPPDLVTHR